MEISENKSLDKQAAEIEAKPKIPEGYMTMELSTKGKFGAPKEFHIRNFKTEDLISLAIEDEDKVQEAAAEMLQGLIYEPKEEVDIYKFHTKEVVETFLRLYKRFYQTTLKGLQWELTDEDKELIAQQEGGKDTDAYRRRIAAIQRGEEKQFFDIDLKNVEYYDIPDNVTGTIRVTQKYGDKDFIVEYSYPRYGDAMMLKKFVSEIPEIKEGEKRFASITENVKFRQRMEQAWKDGENVPLERIPKFTQKDMEDFNKFQKKKAIFATRAVKALHLKSIDGTDISDLPLSKKLEYADDPRLDHSTFEQVNKIYEEMKIGPKEDIKVLDPYTRKVAQIHYTFRLFPLIQAISNNKSDAVDIRFV